MTPVLPVEAIRQAVAEGDYDAAHALLSAHEAELRAAVDDGSLAEARCRETWLELLAAQRGLIDDLRTARDEAGRALDQLGRDRRGMAAYLKGAE